MSVSLHPTSDGLKIAVGLRLFSLTASPQTLPLISSPAATKLRHVVENSYGSSAYSSTDEISGTILLVLRGRVTLDTKVQHASTAGAFALIIVDTTGDPIGPDLDEQAAIIVGYVDKSAGTELVNLLQDDMNAIATITAEDNVLGFVLSGDERKLTSWFDQSLQDVATSSDMTDASGHTALHFAAGRESDEMKAMLNLLLTLFQIDINCKDAVKGQTPLHIACNNGCPNSIQLLCRHGALMLPRVADGKYPVHIAAAAGHINCLIALQNAGADMSQRSVDGMSPLQLAVQKGHLPCTKFLKRCGCNASNLSQDKIHESVRPYLTDLASHELQSFVDCDEVYHQAIIDAAKQRLSNDLCEFIDPDNIEVILNPAHESEAGEMFVSRYKNLRKSFTPDYSFGWTAQSPRCQSPAADDNLEPPIRLLWHGCDQAIMDTILKGGFKVTYSNLTFNVYGAGIYFATDPKLAAYFVSTNVKDGVPVPPSSDGSYSLIFSAVSIGRVGVREPLYGGTETHRAQMKIDLKHPANRNPPLGCDSATGSFMKEVIVYENALAYPLARVKFRLQSGKLIPDPYEQDALGRSYLRTLLQVPTGLGRYSTLSGAFAHLDSSPLAVDTEARLIMGWSADNRSEVSTDEMLAKIAELENKVTQLERENAVLRSGRTVGGGAAK